MLFKYEIRKWVIFLIFMILLCLCLGANSWAANYRPIVLDLTYNHTKYAPTPASNDIIRHFRAYTTCFDGDDDDDGDGTPDKWAIPQWVAYELKQFPGTPEKCTNKPSDWITETDLYNQGIAPKDESYHFSEQWRAANPDSPQLGYDRGHMCMREHACRLGENANYNSFTVFNACPQRSTLNQGIWKDLEDRTAEWADDFGSVWIITGPIIFNKTPSKWLGQSGEVPVAIPDAFFKIVIREIAGVPQVLAFIYPQEGIAYKISGGYDHTPYLTSVDVIEALTDLNFFPGVEEAIEIYIEKVVQIRLWD